MAAASRRGSSRIRIAEADENDELRDAIDPIPFPRPRSPLISIPDPIQNPKGVSLTPKSSHSTLARATSRFHTGNGVRERSCLKGIGEAKSLVPVEVPYFELNEDPSFWKDHNVQVLIRIRPINVSESTLHGYNRCLIQENSQTLTWTGHPESRFTFDNVACEAMSQEKLFRVVGLPMVESCMSGYNGCMFAYGQTGSGKTYTMMGDLHDLDNSPTDDCGMTPRIFEYMFMRKREEEERRSDEQLRYNCKCSFLEIYNEQITDLLEPFSTNLQLREDMKKGVYVENLSEHDVSSVKDVVELLLQGAANRKMAATNMNSESSRSHSVFTCVIESRWEKDSMTHLRYGRLNLVDLAGSERQKSSGAEGERLKEAANINRSLSTLGLVIMSLVDVANGKNRHVPYRDSRLTFLLQDSLGGNSKTTIVANISPSICSSSETLSTLKFAQRAKLIQNNAIVNEDASGDVMALQRQVQELKDQLSYLKKHQNTSRSLCYLSSSSKPVSSGPSGDLYNEHNSFQGGNNEASSDLNALLEKVNNLEAALVGSFRRENMMEAEVKRLEAERKHMNHLVHRMEADVHRTSEMLNLRDETLRRLELLADDLVSSDGYIREKNIALSKEIQLLKERVDRNPGLSQFELENMRLVDQLRVLQNYYEQGERETMLREISHLRNHLLHILERKYEIANGPGTQDGEKITELDLRRKQPPVYLESNILLTRNNDLHHQLEQYQDCGEGNCSVGDICKDNHMMQDIDQHYTVREELSLSEGYLTAETAVCQVDDRVLDVKPDQVKLLTELKNVKQENCSHLKFLAGEVCERECLERQQEHFNYRTALKDSDINNDQVPESSDAINYGLIAKLEKLHKDLEDDKILNSQPNDVALSIVHMEAAKNSVVLRSTDQELHDRLHILTEENAKLRDLVAARDVEIASLSEEWENAIVDLTSFLIDGGKSLGNASKHIQNVANLFPQRNLWVNEHVEKAIKVNIDKEKLISDLQDKLDDAKKIGQELKAKLDSLRGAALTIMESQHLENDGSSKELLHLKRHQHEKFLQIQLKNVLKHEEDFAKEAEKSTDAGSTVTEDLNNINAAELLDMDETELVINELHPNCQTLQLKLDNVSQNVDEKAKQATSLLPKYKKAQDTMEEAELILTALMKANEDANHERDSWKQATKQLRSEKTVLIEELHHLEASNSSALQLYRILQEQMYAHLAEVSDIAWSVVESFQQIKMITLEGLDAIYSDMATFGQELISCIGNLRANINVISHIKVKDFKLHGLHQCPPGALPEQIKFLNVISSLECREVESSSTCRNVKSCSIIPNTKQVLNESHIVQNTLAVPLVIIDDALSEKVELLSKPKNSPEKSVQMMIDIMDLSDDMQLLEEEICGLAVFCDNFVQELASKKEVAADKQISDLDSVTGQKKQTKESMSSDDSFSDISQDIRADNNFLPDDVAGCFKCEDEVHDDRTRGQRSQIEGIFKDIQHLMCQCTQLITSLLATKEVDNLLVHQHDNMQSSVSKVSAILMHGGNIGLLQKYHPKTGIGKHSLQGLNKIRNSLLCVLDSFSSIVHFDNDKKLNGSLLKKLLRDICIIERRVCTLRQRSSSNGRNQPDVGTDYRREFARKNEIVEGLCFDLRLLQESNSYAQDMKDKNEEIAAALIQAQHELTTKKSLVDNILAKHNVLEAQLTENEAALSTSRSELEQAQNFCSTLLKENNELHFLLEDGYSRTAQIEELLEDKNKVINGLEKQILLIRNSAQETIRSSVEEVMSELRRLSKERDHLQEEILDMSDKLELAMSLADEKEAIAVEARQTAETTKIYAEEKEEEVMILEHSVEELEETINALERKVYELKEEVGSYQLIRKDLELEVQSLKTRFSVVENAGEVDVTEALCITGGMFQIPMKLDDLIIEFHEARRYIEDLEMETKCKEEEIKEYKDYISELILHSEAQSSLFQEKFKGLEHMVSEVKADSSTSKPEFDVNRIEKSIARSRGSSSPFRCISSLVQQINLEKDQQLSKAMLHIEELEVLAANKQKEVCLLSTRLAAADTMTHDVIRDLLGVKLDMTNYASSIDQEQLQNLLTKSQQQAEETKAKEMEILNLHKQIDYLLQERDSLIEEINQRKSDIISRRMIIEQLQQREQLLAAQNEMLKMDKVNLSRKIVELDQKSEFLFQSKGSKDHIQQIGITEGTSQNISCEELSKRLAQSDKLLSHARHDLSRYRSSNHKSLLD